MLHGIHTNCENQSTSGRRLKDCDEEHMLYKDKCRHVWKLLIFSLAAYMGAVRKISFEDNQESGVTKVEIIYS